jgi:hypothetical protein
MAPPPPAPGAPLYPSAPLYSTPQLDQMLASIALYPDELLGQILTAATYPLEVVQADRWLQDPANASLRGAQLTQALQQMPWDDSVKALVAFPQILAMLDSNLDWTEQLGDAFLAQQPDVMDSVQRLRARAQAAGTLASSGQQTVTYDDQAIQIAPADTGTVYVPVYSPEVVYGGWPYTDYPPYDLYMPGYAFGTFIAFGILAPYWGWHHWHWHHHDLDIDEDVGRPRDRMRPVPVRPVPWHHEPGHRAGVPYRDPETRTRFEGGGDRHSIHGDYRGYAPGGTKQVPTRPPSMEPRAKAPGSVRAPAGTLAAPGVERPRPAPAVPGVEAARPAPVVPRAEVPRPAPAVPRMEVPRPAPVVPRMEAPRPAPVVQPRVEHPPPPVVQRAPPPAMESFGRGAQVHTQEQRGATSRQSAPGGGGGLRR